MNQPSDKLRLLLTTLFAIWAVVFLYAFVAYARASYEGAGFPDGLNKPAVYLGWQGIAGMLALAIFGVGRRWPKGTGVRGLSSGPLVLAALQVVAILGILWWADAL